MKVIVQNGDMVEVSNTNIMVEKLYDDPAWKVYIQQDDNGDTVVYVGRYNTETECAYIVAFLKQQFANGETESVVVPTQEAIDPLTQYVEQMLSDSE